MANLSTEDRSDIWCDCMREMEPTSRSDIITKEEYRTAVDTFDTWIGTTMLPGMPMLLPLNVRQALSQKEMAQLATALLAKRVAKEVF